MAENKPKNIRTQEIMDAAMQVFVKKGFTDTSMTDIMNQTGLSKGAIYHHYQNKKDLFLSLIDHWQNTHFPDFHQYDDKSLTSSQIFQKFSNEVSQKFRENPAVFLAELEFWSMANRDEEVRIKVKKLYGDILDLFENIINRGIDSGEFKQLDPKVSALSIMTAIQGIIWFTLFESNSFKGEKYLKYVMDFIIHGFQKK
jgi:AcrR family transcriptional regulator